MEYYVNLKDKDLKQITDAIENKVKTEELSVTENDVYEAPFGKAYSKVTVNVPNPSTGTLEITENGEGIDVTNYAAVDVNVSGGGSDFSTAEVTIINSDTSKYYNIAVIYDDINKILLPDTPMVTISVPTCVITIPIPVGGKTIFSYSWFVDVDFYEQPILTGNIVMGDDGFEISGNGSITIKAVGNPAS